MGDPELSGRNAFKPFRAIHGLRAGNTEVSEGCGRKHVSSGERYGYYLFLPRAGK